MFKNIEDILAERIRIAVLAADVVIACALSIFFLDLRLVQHVVTHQDRFTVIASSVLPDLGSPRVLLAVVAPPIIWGFVHSARIGGNQALLIVGAIATGHVVSRLLKFMFGRPRPELFFADGIYGFDFFRSDYAYHSFPSGHAVTCAAVVMAASLVDRSHRLMWLTIGFAIAIVPVIAGHHYLSDALAGFAVGVTATVGFAVLMKARGLSIADKIR